jgi:deazaflavin-dependent oxidoreductase (nitroreductase family)
MGAADPPAVQAGQPPAVLIRLLNPMMKALLRSPLHRFASRQFLLLTVTGRKTGRVYTVPVTRHESGDALVVFAAGGWRRNLRGGAAVRVTLDGSERTGEAQLEEDPDRVVQAYKRRLDELGNAGARMLGLKVNVERPVSAEEIKPAVAERAIATIRLTDDPAPRDR